MATRRRTRTSTGHGYYGDGHFALCPGFNEKAFTTFRDAFRGKGPERFLLSQMVAGSQ